MCSDSFARKVFGTARGVRAGSSHRCDAPNDRSALLPRCFAPMNGVLKLSAAGEIPPTSVNRQLRGSSQYPIETQRDRALSVHHRVPPSPRRRDGESLSTPLTCAATGKPQVASTRHIRVKYTFSGGVALR